MLNSSNTTLSFSLSISISIESSLHWFSSFPDSNAFTNNINSLSSSISPSGISSSNSISSSSSSLRSNLSLFTFSILSSSLTSYKVASTFISSISSFPLFSTLTFKLIMSIGENSSLLSGSSMLMSKSPLVPLIHLFNLVKFPLSSGGLTVLH